MGGRFMRYASNDMARAAGVYVGRILNGAELAGIPGQAARQANLACTKIQSYEHFY